MSFTRVSPRRTEPNRTAPIQNRSTKVSATWTNTGARLISMPMVQNQQVARGARLQFCTRGSSPATCALSSMFEVPAADAHDLRCRSVEIDQASAKIRRGLAVIFRSSESTSSPATARRDVTQDDLGYLKIVAFSSL